MDKIDKKVFSFVLKSIFAVAVVCVMVFVWLNSYMAKKTEQSVEEVSKIYMAEVSEQIQQKFDSITKLRLEQVEGIISRTPAENAVYSESLLNELSYSAEIRRFSYLGFYAEDGKLECIYGDSVELANPESFKASLAEDGTVIEQGFDTSGENYLLVGETASYPMADDGKSDALVAGVSMDYLDSALYLDREGANVYSHIIDKDGKFIIRNSDESTDNYFDRMEERYDVYGGKTPQDFAKELKSAMKNNETYSALISINGDERHIYCAPLYRNSAWYLIAVMPNGVLDETLTELDNVRLRAVFGSVLVIIIVMVIIFILYGRMSQSQLRALDQANHEAMRANRAKSDFLSSMSHDIRTPMNSIIGMTDIALKNKKDPGKVEDCLKKVQLSSRHLLGLINDVLDMSKIESGKVTLNTAPISLLEMMEDLSSIIRPQARAKNLSFDTSIRELVSDVVLCDKLRLDQILLNLLSNAVKFTLEDGHIQLSVYQEPSPDGEEYVRTHFIVKDDGIGMSKEFQSKIFDNFSREETELVHKTVGTGLGMSITKNIVTLMGGKIELNSEQGVGSEFHVTLDLMKGDEKAANTLTPKQLQQTDFTGKRLLIAEDVEVNWIVAKEILSSFGFELELAENGKECVEMLERSEIGYYDAILMDIRMPVMNGYDATEAIRSLTREDRDLPIIAMTADAFANDVQVCLNCGMDAHVAKPLDVNELIRTLQKFLIKEN